MSEHIEYDMDNVICCQKEDTLYYDDGDQALYKVVDLHIADYTWQLVASWDNQSNDSDTCS